ncbi:MAG: hypothetical protein H0X24_25645, partial [Ktedonobacterales bacterium]|nr:hypothetical protein [Ktedonobacterales bacterium]
MADESTPYEPGNLASFLEDALMNLSHELRTPLAVAKGNTTSLIRHDHLLTREERIEILGEIETACDRLETVIQQTLQTAHVLRGSVSLQREPVNLTAVTQQAINAVARYFADARSAPVEIRTDNTPCIVWADADWVERAIVQLLDNAWRYSPEDRPIAITIHANP